MFIKVEGCKGGCKDALALELSVGKEDEEGRRIKRKGDLCQDCECMCWVAPTCKFNGLQLAKLKKSIPLMLLS